MNNALSHIAVLDLSRVLAGPWAGQALADLGADVIKVEKPGTGDDTRSWGPPFLRDPQGRDSTDAAYFLCANRNKKSITVDFTTPEGQAIVRDLARKSDVVLENFKVGGLQAYGLDYASLRTVNPKLIYCSITGFGQIGPYADRSGYDYLVQAMGGMMAVNGHPDGEPGAGPMRVGIPIADICAGSNAVISILAALFHRQTSGRGQHIDIALLDSQVAVLMNGMASWLNGQFVLPRTGNEHPTAVPNGIFPTADGFILISTFNDREFARLAEALGHPGWADDPRFIRSRDRLANRDALVGAMAQALRGKGKSAWMAQLNAAKISCGPINDMADIERDPQIAARGMIVEMAHARKGSIRMAGSPLKLSATPVRYERPPPLAGEHTDEILARELNLPEAEITRLREAEII